MSFRQTPTRSARSHLLLFTRFPQPGQAKTRLVPVLGAEGAAALQRAMTEFVLSRVAPVRAAGVRIEVCFTGGTARQMRRWLHGATSLAEQGGGDLGARLQRAASRAFSRGAGRVVIIGADCPDVDSGVVTRALELLDTHDVAFGPARDGGYYLIGLSRPAPELFAAIPWGTDAVLAQSEAAAARIGLRSTRLKDLSDVDAPADMPVWDAARTNAATLSVIIPTLNDAAELATTLEHLRRAPNVETIVADAGSTDGSPDVAAKAGARVIRTTRGRGHQMNAAALCATGENLLFLHADTRPPDRFPELIAAALQSPDVAGGAFQFSLRETFRGKRLVESLTRWRSSQLQRPYGDQGLFLRRAMFEAVEGFPEWPLLEDVEMIRRLRRIGRVITLDAPASTSARRWQHLGVIRTFLRNQFILLAHLAGASPTWLAAVYRQPPGE